VETELWGNPISHVIAWRRDWSTTQGRSSFQTSEQCGVQGLPYYANSSSLVVDKTMNIPDVWDIHKCFAACRNTTDCATYSFDPSLAICQMYRQKDVFSYIEPQNYTGVWYYNSSCTDDAVSFKTTRYSDLQQSQICGINGTLADGASRYLVKESSGVADAKTCGQVCGGVGHTYAFDFGKQNVNDKNCFCYSSAIGTTMVRSQDSNVAYYARDCAPFTFMYTGLLNP